MTTTGTARVQSVPLGSVDAGRLVFTRGVSHLTIRVNGPMDDLYRARFEGKTPDVRTDGGTVTVRYRMSVHPTRGEIELCGRIPWSIRARMGMSHVVADLEDLELADLEVSAGMSHVEMRLPRPKQTVRLRIGGGASDVELIRPTGVPGPQHGGAPDRGGSRRRDRDVRREGPRCRPDLRGSAESEISAGLIGRQRVSRMSPRRAWNRESYTWSTPRPIRMANSVQ
jgi:hypothetical protein